MQNKPNFPDDKIDARYLFTKDYEEKMLIGAMKKQTQSNPIYAQGIKACPERHPNGPISKQLQANKWSKTFNRTGYFTLFS